MDKKRFIFNFIKKTFDQYTFERMQDYGNMFLN